MAKEAEALQNEAEKGDLAEAETRASTLWSQYDRVTALLTEESATNDNAEPDLSATRRAATAE
jgi:hypothetical protein